LYAIYCQFYLHGKHSSHLLAYVIKLAFWLKHDVSWYCNG
jgi:hypothetical protein